MRLTIEMGDPEGTIMEELANGHVSQDSVAITYAFLMAQHGDKADWKAVNEAILKRWPVGGNRTLTKIKTRAWKIMNEWRERGRQQAQTA